MSRGRPSRITPAELATTRWCRTCGKVLVRRPGEKPAQYWRRRFCSLTCSGRDRGRSSWGRKKLAWDARDQLDPELRYQGERNDINP
jgi:hypothetical protein